MILGARPTGLAKSSEAKAQTAFSFTSCVRQDYSQKRLNSSPKKGLTNHTWASSSNMMPSSAVLKANGRLPCQAEHRTHPER